MDLQLMVCTRQQALLLKTMGVDNKIKRDNYDDGEEIPGMIYSVLVQQKSTEKIFVQGSAEDPPYDMFEPVRLYNTTELLTMIGDCEIRFIPDNTMFVDCKNSMTKINMRINSIPGALAFTLICLLEEKVLTKEVVNKRLLSVQNVKYFS